MKIIVINSPKYGAHEVFVDDSDFELVSGYTWAIMKDSGHKTVYATTQRNKKRIKMHRLIMGIDNPKTLVDHKDRNGLNNQRENLRIASNSDNQANKILRSKSGYMGVTWHKNRERWQAQIRKNGKFIYLGFFIDKIDAAKAYDTKAKEVHGEFANLNFKE